MNRLLMTADTVGGVWSYAVELVSAFSRYGLEVALVTMGKNLDRSQRMDLHGLKNVELFEGRYKLEWMRDPWEEIDLAAEWISSIAEIVCPDLVHLNQYAFGAVDWPCPVVMGAHSCVYSWFRNVKRELPSKEDWGEYKKRVKDGLEGADCIVAPTIHMLSSIYENYSVSTRGLVINNGRSRHQFIPLVKDPYVLTAGRLWDEGKNIKLIASVAHRLPWQVVAAGESLTTNGQPQVHWLGKCSSFELANWMGSASIYTLPAKYEPFGLSVLEAALCGCALVLGDIPSLREIWGNGAVYVNPEDDDALLDTLLELIHKPWLRREYSERARQKGLEYTVSKMASSYLHLYRELIAEKKRELNRGREGVLCA
ncbi:group 1 glycosyl transferase [Chitinispirillum alkaliphilum]|nr:group 1 glycosyl transferase [Chitinispirillum alkaliphilum]